LAGDEEENRFWPGGPQKGLKMRFFEGFLEGFLTERGPRSKFHENTGFQLSHLSLIQRVRSEKGRFGGFGGKIRF
jgi:hypothetical protein